MNKLDKKKDFFDKNGWRIPDKKHITFSSEPDWFYKMGDNILDDQSIISRIEKYQDIGNKNNILETLKKIQKSISSNSKIRNLNNGIKIPFAIKKISFDDIGQYFEDILLKKLSKSFTEFYPESHFKAVIQDNTNLKSKLTPSLKSRYKHFLHRLSQNNICGYYFPQALQEYSVDSQIEQMDDFTDFQDLCLSGPIEVATSLIGTPNLLINKKYYSPVLCLSSVLHSDPRLICCFKSYGRHLEFWCLTQMLTKTKKQVSEQGSGGFSLFTEY